MLNRNLNLIYHSFCKHRSPYHFGKMMLTFKQAGNDMERVCPTPNHEQVALSRKTNTFPMSPEIANLGSSVGTLMLICNSQLIFRGLKCLHIKAQTALSLLGDVISFQRGIFWKMWRIAHRQWDQGIQEILFYLSQAKESLSFTSSSCCG